MKITNYIFFIIILTTTTSCLGIYTEMSNFENDELEWFNAYSDNDTIEFLSNRGNSEILTVGYRELCNQRNPFYIHFIDNDPGETYIATFCIKLEIRTCRGMVRGAIYGQKDFDSDSVKFYTSLGARSTNIMPETIAPFRNYITFGSDFVPAQAKIDTVEINGFYFPNSISYDSTNTVLVESPSRLDVISKYVINKRYGLIYYEKHDGETFYRKNF